MFLMIDAFYRLKKIFEAFANKPEFLGRLNSLILVERGQINSVKDFFQPANDLKTIVDATKYCTTGMSLLMFESGKSHYNDIINCNDVHGCTTSLAKIAGQIKLDKLSKYKDSINSRLSKLGG